LGSTNSPGANLNIEAAPLLRWPKGGAQGRRGVHPSPPSNNARSMRALLLKVFRIRPGLGSEPRSPRFDKFAGSEFEHRSSTAASMARRAERRDGAEYILVPQQQRPLDAGVVAKSLSHSARLRIRT